jgi:hypothetical protein
MEKNKKSKTPKKPGTNFSIPKNRTITKIFIRKIIAEFIVEAAMMVQRGTYIFVTSWDLFRSEFIPAEVPSEKKLKRMMAMRS